MPSDFLLIIDTAYSVFVPQTEKAIKSLENSGLPNPWRVTTSEFLLPTQMASMEQKGFTIEIQDERGKNQKGPLQQADPVVE